MESASVKMFLNLCHVSIQIKQRCNLSCNHIYQNFRLQSFKNLKKCHSINTVKMHTNDVISKLNFIMCVQSNLCTTTTQRTQKQWPLLTGGRCSEVILCNKNTKGDQKMVVVTDRWSLFGGGRQLRFDCFYFPTFLQRVESLN